jgi:nicotinamide mononucleotide transporter
MLGVALSAVAVWLTAVRNRWCWPIGLASVLVYAWIFAGARLYSDALLQACFAFMQVFGWWRWRAAPQQAGRPRLRRPTPLDIGLPLLLGAAGALALGSFMTHTDAALPWLDAALTAFSLVAQYWMARLIRANWLLWIAVDVIYVGVYLSRSLPLTAALYAGFVVLAVLGWRRWAAEPAPATQPA